MFSTNFTLAHHRKRRVQLIIATFCMIVFGMGVAHAQQQNTEFDSPLQVAETTSVAFERGVVEMIVDSNLLDSMAISSGDILVRNFPINNNEVVDLVVEQFFPYRGDIHEAYFAIDRAGNRVVRKRPLEITVKCFRGHVLGYPESTVVFGMSKDMCNGFIEYGETTHTISTDPATQVIAVSDPLAHQPGLQLVREMMREATLQQAEEFGSFRGLEENGTDENPPIGCARINLSVVYGADFLALFGGPGNQTVAQQYIVTLIGQVSEIYRRDGITWVEIAVGQITDGTGIADTAGDLASELCNFVEVAVGGAYPDPTNTNPLPGAVVSDAILILRTDATGSILFGPNADLTKQSLGYQGGLSAGINPVTPGGGNCPANTVLNAVGAASGLIGATDQSGYDTYIVAQALGTLCGGFPTGTTAGITALIAGFAAPVPSGAGTQLTINNCDGGGLPTQPGSIMSSCYYPTETMANITSHVITPNATVMNAFIFAAPLVGAGVMVPAPITTLTATTGTGGVGPPGTNCTGITLAWTSIVGATAEYVYRNTQNVFIEDVDNPGGLNDAFLIATLAGGTGGYLDTSVAGEQLYFYWVTSGNLCNANELPLIADVLNPLIPIVPSPLPPTTNMGIGVLGTIGNRPPPILQVLPSVNTSCTQITVNWLLTSQFGGYVGGDQVQIWRANADDFTHQSITQLNIGVPVLTAAGTFADIDSGPGGGNDLIGGQPYYYWVTPIDSLCTVPSPPVIGGSGVGSMQPSLTATVVRAGASNGTDCNGVLVSWTPLGSLYGVGDTYQIWRISPVGGGLVQVGVVPALNNAVPPVPVTQWLDGSALPGLGYQYQVIATNACGVSSAPLKNALGTSGKLSVPSGVLLEEFSLLDPSSPPCGDLRLSWNTVDRADQYEIWRSTNPDFDHAIVNPVLLGSTRDLSFVDTPPIPGALFYYWVVSVSFACPIVGDPTTSDLSTMMFGTSVPELVQPTDLSATKFEFCDRVRVNWLGTFDGTNYTIHRGTVDDFGDENTLTIGTIDAVGFFDDPQNNDQGAAPPNPGDTYYYWVVASNDCGNSSETNSDSGVMAQLLVAPAGLSATSGTYCNAVQVSWLPRAMADSYRIYRDTDPDPNGSQLMAEISSASSTFDDTFAVNGVLYYYWVEAVNVCSTSTPVLQVAAAEGLNGTLVGPTGMAATNGTVCGFVEVSWNEVSLATNYVVWRNTIDDFLTAGIRGNSQTNSFQDESALDKTLYFYWVTTDTQLCVGSVASASVTGWAMTDITVVTNVDAGEGSECTELLVTWDPISNVLQYEVYRVTSTGEVPDPPVPGPDDPISLDGHTDAFFLDTTAADDGTEYFYWVRSETSCGFSELSDYSRGYLADPNLGPPLGVGQVDSTSCSEIILEWQAVAGADNYEIYRATTNVFLESSIINQNVVTGTVFTDTSAVGGQTYFYWVKAVNVCGLSSESPSAQANTYELDSPTITSISDNLCGIVDIEWDPIDGADVYHVFYSQGPDPNNPGAVFLWETTATTYIDASALVDTPLYYWIRSVVDPGGLNCVSSWGTGSIGIALAPTSPPHTLVASANEFCDSIRIDWITNNTGASIHTIRRNEIDDPDVGFTDIGTTSETHFVDTDVTIVQGTLYYYWVKSETSCGVSEFSEETLGWTQVDPISPALVNATDVGSASCNSVEVSWEPDETADSYEIWRAVSGDGVGLAEFLAETTVIPFQDTELGPGEFYDYWVISKNNCGVSDITLPPTTQDSGSLGQLLAPINVDASDGDPLIDPCGQIDLVWDEVLFASGYNVYRSDTSDFATALLVGVAGSNSFTDVSTQIYPMDYNTQYFYFVESVNSLCSSPQEHSPAEIGTALPPVTVPTGVIATTGTSCGAIWLTWNVATNDMHYDIYRNTTGDDPDPLLPFVTDFATPPFFDPVGINDSALYYYWVRATNACGTSDLSFNTLGFAATTLAGSVSASATQGTLCSSVEIAWDEMPTAAEYHIYRHTSDDPALASLITEGSVITTSPWQDTSAIAGTTYYYWVTGENDCNESPKDPNGLPGWVGVTAQPSSMVATNDQCNVTIINWDAVSEATGYNIYRNDGGNNFGTAAFVASTVKLSFGDYTATPAVEYYYWVTASSASCADSNPSSSDTGYSLPGLETPQNVNASQETHCGEIWISWNDSAQPVTTTYTVHRSHEPDLSDEIELPTTTTDNFFIDDDPAIIAGDQYYYRVKGENSCGLSPFSIVNSGAAGQSAVGPTFVNASDAGGSTCDEVLITWMPSLVADKYRVYRAIVDDATQAGLIVETTLPLYIDSDASLLPSVTYYYWVTSVTACDESLRDEPDGSNSNPGSLGQLGPPTQAWASDPADAGCGAVELNWVPIAGATGYWVYRSTTPSFPGTNGLIGLAEGNSYLDNDLTQSQYDVPLYYWLESVSQFCLTPTSHSSIIQGIAEPPLIIPSALIASEGTVCEVVRLAWDANINVMYYEVWRSSIDDFDQAAPISDDPDTAPTTSEYTDFGPFTPNTNYYYWVKAVNTCGTSEESVNAVGFPAEDLISPDVSVSQGSICDYIQLNWGSVLTANRYRVHRSLEPDDTAPPFLIEVISPTTLWDDFDVIPDLDYYYWITAENDCSISPITGNGQQGWIGNLSPPTNVQASDQTLCGGVLITWNPVDNAISYAVYRQIVDDGGNEDPPDFVGNSDGATTFIDTTGSPTTQYNYWVKSTDFSMCGVSELSAPNSGQALPPMVTPTEVSATYNVQCGQITVSWVHDVELTTYQVYRYESDNVGDALLAANEITGTQFIDNGVNGEQLPFESGLPYYYWIVAVNGCGESQFSQPSVLGQAALTPVTPVWLSDSPACSAITLNWASVDGATTYQLTRRLAETDQVYTVVYEGNETTRVDTDVSAGISYFYSVSAGNACGTSAPTHETFGYVESSQTGPAPPSNVNASNGAGNCSVSISWNSVDNATQYKVYRGADCDTLIEIGSVSQSPLVDYDPPSSAYYSVRALISGCGLGGYSVCDVGSPDPGPPTPSNFSASDGTDCDGIRMTWDSVSDAGSYCIYRSLSEGPQSATLQACGITVTTWLDTEAETSTPYWYWVTSVSLSGNESCALGTPDQGWPSEPIGAVNDLVASQCYPIEVEWWGVNSCFDVARGSTSNVIATCINSPFIDNVTTGSHNYYVRPRSTCGEVGDWTGPVVGFAGSCFGADLPDGLLGTDPGDPTILIVPSQINRGGNSIGTSPSQGTDSAGHDSDDLIYTSPPWSLCLVGDAEIRTDLPIILGDSRWSLPLGGNWRLVGHDGYADLFYLAGSDWEHVRSLRVEEIESGVAQTLLEDGIAAVVGTVPEVGNDVLITGVSSDDCDKDGIPDGCEILLGMSYDMNIDGIPDNCSADLNGDGIVDTADLLQVLQNFGVSEDNDSDINSDGIVDQSDVLAILMEMSH